MTSLLAGLAFGLSLIVAIGAQNAFVLRVGLTRRHVLPVVAVCALSDLVLIGAGVAGLGVLVDRHPGVLTVARIAGAAFLTGYAVLAIRRAARPVALTVPDDAAPGPGPDSEASTGPSTSTSASTSLSPEASSSPSTSATTTTSTGTSARTTIGTRAAAVGTALALTWLNPHVYLDTVVLLGSVAAGYGELRWWFGAGAMLGSLLWFTALGYGARLLTPLFARPHAWRVLDGLIAAVMLAIAAGLLLGLRG